MQDAEICCYNAEVAEYHLDKEKKMDGEEEKKSKSLRIDDVIWKNGKIKAAIIGVSLQDYIASLIERDTNPGKPTQKV